MEKEAALQQKAEDAAKEKEAAALAVETAKAAATKKQREVEQAEEDMKAKVDTEAQVKEAEQDAQQRIDKLRELQQDGAAPDKIVEAKAAAQMAQSRSQKEAIKAAEDDEVIRLQIQAKQQQD